MDLFEQARRLAPFFQNRDPGEPPPDPAGLGDPAAYNGTRWAVEILQDGSKPPDWVYDRLDRDLKAALLQACGDPDALLREQLATRWHLMGAADLLQPPKRPEYLILDKVRRPGLVVVFGAPGDLKSMFLMDLAVCIAAGDPWLEPLPDVGAGGSFGLKQGPVLWLDMDNGPDRLIERFGALCRARAIQDAPIHAVSLPQPAFDASKPEEADLLAAQIRDLGAVACFVDNLGTVSGGRDENSSEMQAVMLNLRVAAHKAGAVLFLIHHARKGTGAGGAGREGDRLRGHSSIEAALDLALLVERAEDDITVRSTKTRDDPIRPFVARWSFDRNPEGALDQARFWFVETVAPPMPDYVRLAQDIPALLETLPAPPNQTQLVKALADAFDVQRKAALAAIKYAVTHALIRETGGPGKTSPRAYHPVLVVH